MTPERIAELRGWLSRPEEDVLVIYQHALATIPELLDEIERLQALLRPTGHAPCGALGPWIDALHCELVVGHDGDHKAWHDGPAGVETRTWPPCTGMTALWCPVHGDCSCPEEGPDDPRDAEHCPLHSFASSHGEAAR